MNNRVQGWAMVPAQHVPLRDVDYRRVVGSYQGTSGDPSGAHLGYLLREAALFRNTTWHDVIRPHVLNYNHLSNRCNFDDRMCPLNTGPQPATTYLSIMTEEGYQGALLLFFFIINKQIWERQIKLSGTDIGIRILLDNNKHRWCPQLILSLLSFPSFFYIFDKFEK